MKRLILASLAVAATLASCTKESEVGTTTTTTTVGSEITFAPYAGASLTKGTPIDSNSDFQGDATAGHGSFVVSADFQSTTTPANSGQFFDGLTVNYTDNAWVNETKMYWPNETGTVYFGAYYPQGATGFESQSFAFETSSPTLSFAYTVAADTYATSNDTSTEGEVADHRDVMYAVTSRELATQTTDDEEIFGTETPVTLHFKHALTQIAFTATKDADISVDVKSIQICNVMDGGTFTASAKTDDDAGDDGDDDDDETTAADYVDMDNTGTWSVTGEVGHYTADLDIATSATSITVATEVTTLTSSDALMLIPQELDAWDAEGNGEGSGSFLAIKCVIKHTGDANVASIVDGYVFVPFDTDAINYSTTADGWKPGYKITYNLHFGGGYTIPDDDPEDPTIPDPGTEPDPDDVVETLREITYTTTVDEWVPVAATETLIGSVTE